MPTEQETAFAAAPHDAEAAERDRRRRLLWTTLLLLLGLPAYLIAASFIAAAINPVVETADGPARALHWSVELAVYLGLGVLWALPLKRLVQGLGKRREDA